MSVCDCHNTVQEHATEIALLKESTGNVITKLSENTDAVHELVTKLAVYIEKNNTLEDGIKESKSDIKDLSEKIDEKLLAISNVQVEHGKIHAANQPVIDAARTINMKVLGGLFVLLIALLGFIYTSMPQVSSNAKTPTEKIN